MPGQRLYESYTGIKGTYSFALSYHNILNVSWNLAIKHFVVLFSFSCFVVVVVVLSGHDLGLFVCDFVCFCLCSSRFFRTI